ncbi:MAG: DUF4382 domain-containing protein [Bacteroidetes bacterium]|nr:DUF4382 domain-containing protein [Bacteroidota bacterium]MBU1719988.1 DUF4382 domain-containing protein [Bacteroidota bacterium]
MKPNFLKSALILCVAIAIVISGCKKKDDPEPVVSEVKAHFSMSIGDASVPHGNKSAFSNKSTNDVSPVINPAELTKCEVTISAIKLKNVDGAYIDVLTSPAAIDLMQFQGTVSSLLSVEIPVGSYTAIRVEASGASTTYEGNNYTASVSGGATVTLADVPGMTFTSAQGVTNAFASGPTSFELPMAFTLVNTSDAESVRLFFDAESSTYVVSYTYQTNTWNFAGIRPLPNVGVILEDGIQQIRHSPPLGITIVGTTSADYYGLHTFVDFKSIGGTINSHTSQHVFRGEDGTLLIDAETMAINNNPLTPNAVAASGETDVRADETFNFSAISATLQGQGYTLQSGKTYYFSLRKTWNITTNGQTYDLTRICEPMPVTIP